MKKRIILIVIVLLILAIVGPVLYYNSSLDGNSNGKEITFKVESGSSVKGIIEKLEEEKVVKNKSTCYLYAKFSKINNLQAGSYKLTRNIFPYDFKYNKMTDFK